MEGDIVTLFTWKRVTGVEGWWGGDVGWVLKNSYKIKKETVLSVPLLPLVAAPVLQFRGSEIVYLIGLENSAS